MAIETVTRLRDYEFDLEEKLTIEIDCNIQKDMVVYEIMLKSRSVSTCAFL
jgi:flagellar assembly factor FliW